MTWLAAWSVIKRFWPAALVVACIIALLAASLHIQSLETQRDNLQRVVGQQEAELAAMQKDANAKEQASVERADDAATNAKIEKETTDAIRSAADPRLALSCLRLKRAGVAAPAACR